MNKELSVTKYISQSPKEVQINLKQLRNLIKSLAPEAVEKISYGMPFYEYHGRLVYFAFAKHHIGLYIPPPIIENHKDDLKSYKTSKSAVQFPLGQDLPVDLIKKLIKARMEWNKKVKQKAVDL